MKCSLWLQAFSFILLFHTLIIASTSLSLSNFKDKKQHEQNLLTKANNDEHQVTLKETVGEPRWLASYVFPLFPQFYNVNYGKVWNFLKRSDTIGYFVIRDVINVSKYA